MERNEGANQGGRFAGLDTKMNFYFLPLHNNRCYFYWHLLVGEKTGEVRLRGFGEYLVYVGNIEGVEETLSNWR